MSIGTIGVLTSGGDSSGMNAAIRAVVRGAIANGLKVFGIRRGYQGMMEDDIFEMGARDVGGIVNRGGTVLFTARSKEFMTREGQQKAVDNLKKHGIEGLVVIGGDGSFHGAYELSHVWGIQCIGVPGTIDNDIAATDYTIGYDTAVNVAVDAIDKIRDTALSHERLFVVEVMGRHAGYIAIDACIAGGGEGALIPEAADAEAALNEVIDKIKLGRVGGKKSSIVIVAEGFPISAQEVAKRLEEESGFEVRLSILGHMQRGGMPTALDRIYASKLGYEAVNRLIRGETDKMVGIVSNKINVCPIEDTWTKKKGTDQTLLDIIRYLSV